MSMKLPVQIQNIPPDRTASAPYNFVPLPEKVVCAAEDVSKLPDHSSFANKGFPHSGFFEIGLTTMSPLYIRGPVTSDEFIDQDDHAKNKPDFFHTRRPDLPVIPGSSLRGMLRSLLEIAAYGKIQGVSKRKLFFRSVGNETVGNYYLSLTKVSNATAIRRGYGFARKTDRNEWQIEACDVAQVEMLTVAQKFGITVDDLYTSTKPSAVPNTNYQHSKVWVRLGPPKRTVTGPSFNQVTHIELSSNTANYQSQGFREGVLVLTGRMQKKHKAFVFLLNIADKTTTIDIPNDREALDENEQLLERFNNDQVTSWQKNAFPDKQPGVLRNGDPVFYITKNDRLVFFGRAFLFRLPYQNSPLDMVPEALRSPDEIDYAEALFGFVKAGSQSRPSFAGRVSVTDATLKAGQSNIWLSDTPITPRILSTPKPSTIQHYLVQKESGENRLAHYGDSPVEKTAIRGFKRYWHQGLGGETSVDKIIEAITDNIDRLKSNQASETEDKDLQHTTIKPIRPGIRFSFRIYFENLSDSELGALCWILQPSGDEGREYCHHLGMGKPLGLGAVKFQARLFRTDRQSRYRGLFNQGAWLTGTDKGEDLGDREILSKLTRTFEQHILSELQLDQKCQSLQDLKRIGMLLKTMEWPGFSPDPDGKRHIGDRPNTRYMSINFSGTKGRARNEFLDRPVLPTPSAFGKLTGEVEPDLNLKTTQKAVNLPVKASADLEISENESLILAIKALNGPGDLSQVEDLYARIEALKTVEYRVSCAQKLRDWAVKIKIKEKHKEKQWWKGLMAILGEG